MSEEPFFGYETEQDRDAAVKKLETFLTKSLMILKRDLIKLQKSLI